ncbi:serine hydrolase FSH [Bisporella sp. PMI_857]|nr:serine hydrolase FSH [Bisporella sp. PMI_857]
MPPHQTTSGVPGQNKPAILCLHGGGTNSTIFNVQMIRIQRALAEHFTFVFPDGPYETGAGPGVLPFFEGCDPFFRWISRDGEVDLSAKVRDLLLASEAEQRRKDGRGFVGVLGFSQGARVASGLLLEQQLRGKDGGEGGKGLGFGVFLNGTSPVLGYGLGEEERKVRLSCLTLHVVGLEDPWREESRRLLNDHCERDSAVLLEFPVGHRLPTVEEDTEKIKDEILRMWRETQKSES